MKKLSKLLGLVIIGSTVFTSCKKETASVAPEEISASTLASISAHGFGTSNVQKIDEGYLVEGDIVLTADFLAQRPAGSLLRIGSIEQYRTTNLVSQNRNISLALDSKLRSKAGYTQALAEVARRYNAENLTLTFTVVTSGANITFSNATGSYLASAGFPSGGNPFNSVKVNSRAIGTGTSTTFINYLATIMAHEGGHCIGMRHTDYADRSYSCGGATSNEGASSVGAIFIPGTSAGPEAGSWMLACIGSGVNRPFTGNDKTALSTIY